MNRKLAFLMATLSSLIFGITFTLAKDVMPYYINPFGFILVRVLGATILFWLMSFFIKKETIKKQDFVRLALCGLLGVCLNMLMFFKGLSLTSAINASVLMVTAPILVLVFSWILKKEPWSFIKFIGVVLGLIGTVVLIYHGNNQTNQSNIIGDLLVFCNAASYAMYLILVKKLMKTYAPFTVIKWVFTFGLIGVIPFGIMDFISVQWVDLSIIVYYKIGFVVLFTSFLAYLFNIYSMKVLQPSTQSVFIYLQPVFAALYAISFGSEQINKTHVISTIIIFIGIYFSTFNSKKSLVRKK